MCVVCMCVVCMCVPMCLSDPYPLPPNLQTPNPPRLRLIAGHEALLTERFLAGLSSLPHVELFGTGLHHFKHTLSQAGLLLAYAGRVLGLSAEGGGLRAEG